MSHFFSGRERSSRRHDTTPQQQDAHDGQNVSGTSADQDRPALRSVLRTSPWLRKQWNSATRSVRDTLSLGRDRGNIDGTDATNLRNQLVQQVEALPLDRRRGRAEIQLPTEVLEGVYKDFLNNSNKRKDSYKTITKEIRSARTWIESENRQQYFQTIGVQEAYYNSLTTQFERCELELKKRAVRSIKEYRKHYVKLAKNILEIREQLQQYLDHIHIHIQPPPGYMEENNSRHRDS